MCEDNIDIMSILKRYVLYWYQTDLLHPGIYRMEVIIWQKIYWYIIGNAIRKEVTNCDTCQRTELSKIKYGKLSAKEAEEIPRNSICVDLIVPYIIRRKGHK